MTRTGTDLNPIPEPLAVVAKNLAAAYPGLGQYAYARSSAYGLFRAQPPGWGALSADERARWDYVVASLLVFVCREQAPLQAEAVLAVSLDGWVAPP